MRGSIPVPETTGFDPSLQPAIATSFWGGGGGGVLVVLLIRGTGGRRPPGPDEKGRWGIVDETYRGHKYGPFRKAFQVNEALRRVVGGNYK